MIPQNLSLAELERWTYIENLPGKELLDMHWRTIFSQGYETGRLHGLDTGRLEGYDQGFDEAKELYKHAR